MTPERAIELLKISTEISFAHNITEKRNEPRYAYMIAKTAIERCMIAKKPDYEGDGYDENGELIYDTAYCPNCRHMFEVYYDAVKHCPDYGQLIDWSDVECI